MSEERDRRRGDRHHVYLATEIVTEDASWRSGITRDVSDTGLLLLTRTKLDQERPVTLRIHLPTDDERVLEVSGTIVRQEPLTAEERGTWREKVAVRFDVAQGELAREFERFAAEQARMYGWS